MKKVISSVLFLSLFLVGCEATASYTVSFETDTDVVIEDVVVEEGDVFSLPDDPVKEGYEFKGWFYDENFTDRFSSSDVQITDFTLYAKWRLEAYTIRILDFDGNVLMTKIEHYGFQLIGLLAYNYTELYMEPSVDSEEVFDQVLTGDIDVYAYSAPVQETMKIGANIYTFDDNFMNGVVRPELERYAEELGMELVVVDSQNDQARLNDQVDLFISEGVDVLLIQLVDPSAADTIISKAWQADIPLILYGFNGTTIDSRYDQVWTIRFDLDGGGVEQGILIYNDWLDGDIVDQESDGVLDYVLLQGDLDHPMAQTRTENVISTMLNNGLTINELALESSSYWGTADADQFVTEWLSSGWANEIDVIIANNDGMAFGAVQALQAEGYDIPVYGIDALEEAKDMLRDGRMAGTVLLDGEELARRSLDMAYGLMLEGDIFGYNSDLIESFDIDTNTVYVPYVGLTKENVE